MSGRRVGAALALALLAGACASLDPQEDTRIEAEVKARLVGEKSENLTRIDVLSTNGVVYLSGTAETPTAREKAENLAAAVPGVRRVTNTLLVRPP
jgi:hyperosmotically inducible periplasmic protein